MKDLLWTNDRSDVDQPGPLKVSGLTLSVPGAPERTIVENIDLTVPAGGVLALIGPSGSGKTSIAMAILGLWPGAIDGTVVDGHTVLSGLTPREYGAWRRRAAAVMMQDPRAALDPMMTVGRQLTEILRFRASLSRYEVSNKALQQLTAVGLEPAERIYRAYPHQLSGGMAQRVVLAMALACRPRLLIADEPFSALDADTASAQIEVLLSARRDQAFSMILITHDLRLADRLADEIAVIEEGKIVEAGPRRAVFHQPKTDYTRKLLQTVAFEPVEAGGGNDTADR